MALQGHTDFSAGRWQAGVTGDGEEVEHGQPALSLQGARCPDPQLPHPTSAAQSAGRRFQGFFVFAQDRVSLNRRFFQTLELFTRKPWLKMIFTA